MTQPDLRVETDKDGIINIEVADTSIVVTKTIDLAQVKLDYDINGKVIGIQIAPII